MYVIGHCHKNQRLTDSKCKTRHRFIDSSVTPNQATIRTPARPSIQADVRLIDDELQKSEKGTGKAKFGVGWLHPGGWAE